MSHLPCVSSRVCDRTFVSSRGVAAIALAFTSTLVGCSSSYVAPGSRADLLGAAPVDLQEVYGRKPVAPMPAHLAVARVQGAGYSSYVQRGYGTGSMTLVGSRDPETDADLARLGAMPSVAAVAVLNRMVVPAKMETVDDLRTAAASVQSDVLLAYTFDTSFRIDDHDIGPLGPITLGFIPNREAVVDCTASAVFVDVRTGFVYGLAEGTAHETQLGNAWTDDDAVDDARRRAERAALDKLLPEIERTWSGIVAMRVPARGLT